MLGALPRAGADGADDTEGTVGTVGAAAAPPAGTAAAPAEAATAAVAAKKMAKINKRIAGVFRGRAWRGVLAAARHLGNALLPRHPSSCKKSYLDVA
ncbi:MAG: hypothetical protein LBT53_06085 [Puniceicoccales bacterium]|jgi:hypothetical protein|nr:hypothetical protein [Puniceicoccales bacterium]